MQQVRSEGRRRNPDLWLLSATFFFIFFGPGAAQQFIGVILRKETAQSKYVCSLVLATVYITTVIWRPLTVYTLEWFGAKLSIILGLLTYTLFSVCASATTSFLVLVPAAVIWGWGAAAIWTTGPTRILEETESRRYGSAAGVFYSAVYVGQGLGVFLLGLVAARLESTGGRLQWVFAIAAGLGLVGNLISARLPARELHSQRASPRAVLAVLATRQGALLSLILFASGTGFAIVLSAMASDVADATGIGQLSKVTIGFYIGRLVVSWFSGKLCDRVGRKPVLCAGYAIGALGLVLAGCTSQHALLFGAAFALGMQVGFTEAPLMAVIGDSFESGKRHLAFAATQMWKNLGVGLIIVLSQLLDKALTHRAKYFVFAAATALCGLLVLALRTAGARREEES